MISEKTKKWIEAGKMFAINLDSNILCPECEMSNLEARDIMNEEYPKEFERLLYCPKCEAKNFIKLKIP